MVEAWFNMPMDFLKIVWKKWLKIGRIIGNFNAQVILTVFYFLLLWPVGLIFRLFADPLRLRSGSKGVSERTNFEKWEHPKDDVNTARRQY